MVAVSNQSAWIIAGAILLAAVLIVAAMVYLRIQDRDACAHWQETYRSAVRQGEDHSSDRVAETLYASKPEGCAVPR